MIRPMTWRDLPSVIALEGQLFPVDAWTPEQFWSELAQETRTYLVLDDDDQVQGYGGVMTVGATADLQTIAIAPAMQGRGAGRELLEALIDVAVQRECTEMLLEVRSDNAAAITMYERRGFEAIARRTDYYGAGIDANIMRLRPLGAVA
jgi:[ribosomal protein S18]-alanine N-acetyltransferase